MLASLLGQHSKIRSDREIFSKYMPRRWGDNPRPPISRVFEETRRNCAKEFQLIEVKHLGDQNLSLYPGLVLKDWIATAFEHGFSSHLMTYRKNGLRRIVSHVVAQKTGRYVLKDDCPPAEARRLEKIVLNPGGIAEGYGVKSLLEWLDEYTVSHRRVKAVLTSWCVDRGLPPPCVLIYEEDIEPDPLWGYRKVCDYLRLPPERPVLSHRKIIDSRLEDILLNYEEVAAVLRGTEHAWMLF